MPTTLGFHHAALVSGDAERSIAFYRDLLGFRLLDREANEFYFGNSGGTPGSLLAFTEAPDGRRGHWGVGGIHHIAFGVETSEAQLKWKRWLTDHSVEVTGPYDRGWFHSIYMADPDGQILEIATAGPGYQIDEPMDALGHEMIMPKTHQLARNEDAIAATTFDELVPEISPDMTLLGIHHITGHTQDLDVLNDFYSKSVGLRIVKRSVNQDDPTTPHFFWASYDGKRVEPGSSLTFFGWPKSNYVTRPGVGQTHHIAFRARNEDEQLEWRENLVALGVRASSVIDRGYYKSIDFTAPDGLQVEIATDTPGFGEQ